MTTTNDKNQETTEQGNRWTSKQNMLGKKHCLNKETAEQVKQTNKETAEQVQNIQNWTRKPLNK